MKIAIQGLVAAALAVSAGQAQAVTNMVTNGSFELTSAGAVFNGGVAEITTTNSTALTNWATSGGSQFKLNRNYDASAGKTSLDLSGANGGVLTSISNFMVGKTYRVSFDLSGNPGATVNPIVGVRASGYTQTTNLTFTRPVGQTAADMGWVRVAYDFVATDTLHRVLFTNANLAANKTFGPVIDNVIIGEAVPEPQNWALFIIGFGLIGAVSRRKAAQQAA